MAERNERAVCLLLMGAVIGPLALMSVYLGFSRWPTRWFTAESDWLLLILSLGVGVVCLARLPIHPLVRVALSCVYVPVGGYVIIMYTLYFVGHVFGDWL